MGRIETRIKSTDGRRMSLQKPQVIAIVLEHAYAHGWLGE